MRTAIIYQKSFKSKGICQYKRKGRTSEVTRKFKRQYTVLSVSNRSFFDHSGSKRRELESESELPILAMKMMNL